MDLVNSLAIAATGLRAQGTRLRVISENIANADSTAQTPGGEPYRRKLISFRNVLDRELGAQVVRPNQVSPDRSDFELRYDPSHPAANAEGYVLMPNVNTLIEMNDMREAQRSYEANLAVVESSRGMMARTLEILRG